MVFTSKQVLEESKPILYVVRDHEGDWQFLSGMEQGEVDGRIVGMEEILELDPTLGYLIELVSGMEARREAVGEEWVISTFPK